MNTLIFILIVVLAFVFMEFMAWFSHKYIMHGFLWVLHKDHHIRDGRKMEWNDVFALIFGLPSILMILAGAEYNLPWVLAAGIGIALYGLGYFLFHDIYVHHRIRMLTGFDNRYLRATRRAHEDHHQPHQHRNYGFLLAPWQYYREEFRKTGHGT